MANGRYVRFNPKQDNVNEVISADHINRLQNVSEATQRAIYKAQDRDFLDKALFVLEHHRSVNGLWVDLFSDTSKIDLPPTTLTFSDPEKAVIFHEGSTDMDGYIYSRTYINPNGSNMKKVMVVAQTHIPEGSDIIISVSNNGVDFFDIDLSDSNTFEIPTDGQRLKLRARFVRTDENITPRLDAWAILFRDPQLDVIEMPDGSKVIIGDPDNEDDYDDIVNIMHSQLLNIGPDDHHPQEHKHDGIDGSGLVSHTVLTDIGEDDHHPKDHKHGEDGVDLVDLTTDVKGTLSTDHLSYYIWTGRPGTTGMFFDPNMGDRLVYVKSPDDETYLFYDMANDRLSHTITIVQGIAIWEDMIYGPYRSSSGEENIVLQGTEKEHHDATDSMIIHEIEKMTAPAAPQNLTINDPGVGGQLDITWDANIEHDLVGYNLYMKTSTGSSWTRVNASGLISGNGYTATGLNDNVSYDFHVTAVDNTGYESAQSNVASGTPTTGV